MAIVTITRPATMDELQAEIDRLHEGHARIYDENQRLRKELREALDTNDFDAKRLRRLALLLGLSVPESDETLLGCAGTVLGQACRVVEQIFKNAPGAAVTVSR